MTSVKDRIRYFAKYKNLSIKRFEEMCGLSNSYVSSMRKGLGEDKLQAILKRFPELSRNWLVFGEEPMLNTSPYLSATTSGSNAPITQGNGAGSFTDNSTSTITNTYGGCCEEDKGERASIISLIEKQSEHLSKSQEQLSSVLEQLSKYQDQVNRLLSIIEKQNG